MTQTLQEFPTETVQLTNSIEFVQPKWFSIFKTEIIKRAIFLGFGFFLCLPVMP